MRAFDYLLEIDDLSIALTKPPMRMGVPITAFFGSMIFSIFIWIFYRAFFEDLSFSTCLFFFAFWLFLYVFMYLVTIKDKFGLSILWVNHMHFRRLSSSSFWHYRDTYQP